jgi:hypothetical protein
MTIERREAGWSRSSEREHSRVEAEAKTKVHDWGDKVDSGIGLRSTLAQGCPTVNVLESTLEWT